MEKNDGRTLEDGDRKQKFVLNMLSWKCLPFIQLEVIRKQAEIHIWSVEKWSGQEMYTGFTNVL